jgi:pyridoxal/pyridoxine/pyridoxamine kinase
MTTNFAIALSASKDFPKNFIFHNGEGEKKMLKGKELKEAMDCFQYLSSLNIQNVISSFRSNNQRDVIDNIMMMKKESKFEFIHNIVFPSQGKEKVYIFKILNEGP